uniref:Uncharacterized protein n=1 Tax=Tanacetum cinerariifolium TaxID=118510 RepID=A0A699JN23_TANCI|nr:hypothetical protein [Tanacetum cinerariifolium]
MNLLNQFLETCATLTKKVGNLEQDKIAQAIEITKLKQRVRRLEKKRKLKASKLKRLRKGKIAKIDAVEDVTLEEVDAEKDAKETDEAEPAEVEEVPEVVTAAKLITEVVTIATTTITAALEVDAEVQGRLLESQAQVYHLDLEHAQKVLSMQKTNKAYPAEVEKVLEVVTAAKLMTEVVTTATTTITAASVPKASAPRRRRGVIIQDLKEATTVSLNVQSEVMSKDKGKGILVEEPKPLKRQAQIEQDEAFARKLEAQLNANINWNEVIEQVKRKKKQDNTVMRYQSLKRKPVTKAQAKKNMMVYLKIWLDSKWTSSKKGEKEIEEEKSRLSKRKGKNLKQESAKKQKIDEEVEKLKTHLKIVPNDKDDVYTEATPLDLKILIVDYQIHTEHNKPYYKIIRADGSHQLFLSLIIMLRNFNREDLEMLYGLAKVKSWRLLESCGVHIITFTTTQMILLVERRYHLTRFTLDQMLNNVRLEVEEESEGSFELLRFLRRQQQEGYKPK